MGGEETEGRGGEERKSENSGRYLKNFFVFFFKSESWLFTQWNCISTDFSLRHSENMFCTVTKCPISAQDN